MPEVATVVVTGGVRACMEYIGENWSWKYPLLHCYDISFVIYIILQLGLFIQESH